MSGQYVHNNGVVANVDAPRFVSEHSIQYELGQSGYQTAMAGKYLNYWTTAPPYFDRWATFVHPPGYFNSTFNVNGVEQTVSMYSTRFVEAQAGAMLDGFEADDGTPWFLNVAPFAPHGPPVSRPKYADVVLPPWRRNAAVKEPVLGDKPAYVRSAAETGFNSPYDEKDIAEYRKGQLRTLMSVDDMVASIFDKLKTLGEEENTLVFYLSDNGVLWFEHGFFGKRVPYDPSVRIPLFVLWPGRVAAGSHDPRIVANIDLAPTIYEAAGITPSYVIDGESLFTSDRPWVLTEYSISDPPDVPSWLSVWTPGRVYTRYTTSDGSPMREFYRTSDPLQLRNVYRDGIPDNKPGDQAALDAMLESASVCSGSDCP